jgi:hypothetical protein
MGRTTSGCTVIDGASAQYRTFSAGPLEAASTRRSQASREEHDEDDEEEDPPHAGRCVSIGVKAQVREASEHDQEKYDQ